MPTVDRLLARGTRRGERSLQLIGDEFRERRLTLALSQAQVAAAVGVSRSVYSRIENGKLATLSITRSAQIGSVLGLDVSVRAYPGSGHLRDEASRGRLERIVANVSSPLVARKEVPLPQRADAPAELRAWDLMVTGASRRTSMELEMRLRDAQALERRIRLKLRDDPVDGFVLLVANTRTNREVLAQHPDLLGMLRLTPGIVLRALREGRHPPSGIVLI